MKVLMIVTWYTPRDAKSWTAGVFHYEQSMALKKYCDTALLWPIDKNEQIGITKQEEKGLLTYRLAQKSNFLPLRFIEMYKDAKRVVEDYKPDIIHAHVAEMAGVVAVLLGRKYKIPVIITEHNPIELSHFESVIKRAQVRFAYKRSKRNICVSKDSMNRLSKIFKDCSFEVIYNGIINPSSIELESHNYMKEGRINCMITAAFYDKEIKGYQYLLPAMKKLIDEGIEITLHICGGGDYFDYYKNLAKELGIEEYCIFYGQCERKKVYSIMKQVDFCISSSIFECSGVSVQEAMLFGKPLVVTRSGGANSLCTDHTAIVVDKESVDALVQGIKDMIANRDKFDEKEISEYAFYNFEIDEVSKNYMSIYNELLEGKEI